MRDSSRLIFNLRPTSGIGAPLAPVPFSPLSCNSNFGRFDTIAKFDITTPYKRLPVAILGDYVQNTRACANVGNIATAAQLPTTPPPLH
jgi:hypothetical protein